MNSLVRKGSFDAAHRVMNESMKCFNVHWHTYLYELHFEYKDEKEIGYAIDFKEIKRIVCQFIDDYLDHAAILNPEDAILIWSCKSLASKYWLMSLNWWSIYCNPSAENIAKELFLIAKELHNNENLWIKKIVLYETPNCFVECESVNDLQRSCFLGQNYPLLAKYKREKWVVEYDDRLISKN